jgi:lysophospholipase L1-like esterase
MSERIELKPNQRIVFIGDSITDAGRLMREYRPLGYGYVRFIANQLWSKYPQFDLDIVNTGINGDSIRDLQERWQKDCLDYQPDILSILIGINDVCRQYYESTNEAAFLDEYESIFTKLLSQAKLQSDCRIVLMEPFLFCDNKELAEYRTLQKYIDVVRKLAKQFKAVLVPLQALIDEKITQIPPKKWSDDMVHPYLWAHSWIARRWLEAAEL